MFFEVVVCLSSLAFAPGAQQLGLASGDPDFRCGTHTPSAPAQLFSASDCSGNSTTIRSNYDPAGHQLYRIPVVVHVLMNSNGEGAVSDAMIRSQIDVLNEDFGALTGTPGQSGTAAGISFFLATVDPSGNQTTGITRTVENDWFDDTGSYYDALGWDPDEYLNIYTNGTWSLGYSFIPQHWSGLGNQDRIVILWSAFGRNSSIGAPFNMGRTLTHQVGHYLGLLHTFTGGCGSSACYQSGDLICDTEPESYPVTGCPSSHSSCGSADPFHNYMDSTDDACKREFTPEQVNRMRCTLENWRPGLAQTQSCAATATTRSIGLNVNGLTSTRPVLGSTLHLQITASGWTQAYLYSNARPGYMLFGNGMWLLVDNTSPRYFTRTLNMPNASMSFPLPSDMSLCGTQACVQALLTGGSPGFAFTNAVDLTLGL